MFWWKKLHKIKSLLVLTLYLAAISLTIEAAPPSNLDPTFGDLGKVVVSPDGSEIAWGNDMALQADGKIVMVGTRSATGGGIVVARFNPNGGLDTTFDGVGWVIPSFGTTVEQGVTVAIQPDGKIVVGGMVSTTTGQMSPPMVDFAIVRLNPDGSLDTTFDGDGKVTISFDQEAGAASYRDEISVLRIAGDGKIVIAGRAHAPAASVKLTLARLNPDGSLDTTFGSGGKVIGTHGAFKMYTDLVILPDGKFVATSYTHEATSWRAATKYNLNGEQEWLYIGSTPLGQDSDALNAIVALPDGKFIVVGKSLYKIIVERINADGTRDNTFIRPGGLPNGQLLSVAVQADGKIVAVVESTSFSLVRFNANGSLDTTFGTGGFVSTDLSAGEDRAKKVLIQTDGKLLVGGFSYINTVSPRFYFSMARYLGSFNNAAYKPLYDYDGDGKADVSVFRPSENKWYVLRSSDQAVTQTVFAVSGDVPAPSDFDGDGKTDLAVFRPSSGDWWYLSSINNSQNYIHWGLSGDVPRPGDYDGDGKSDYIVFRPSNIFWYRISNSISGGSDNAAFGLAGDKSVSGDFDGDGKTDRAIYRPSSGDWWYQSSINNAQLAVRWGISTDIPAPADYDGDGKTDIAVYRPSTGVWYIINSSNGSFTIMNFGLSEDKPVPADYDGDGKADIAVFRPSTGVWYLQRSTAGFTAIGFGLSSDIPTPNSFVP